MLFRSLVLLRVGAELERLSGVVLPGAGPFEAFARLGLANALVIDTPNQALFKSIRNAKKYQFLAAAGANVYDILRHPVLVLTQAGAKALEGALS